ncbi:hypothetical protein H2203_003106 [Taxawa tesnikishii (nom. ined.)]|nr:hypothetical protein H2203_003106 [Dothideales sp. JES 119]
MYTPQPDHVVVLLPHAEVLNPPAWITDHFTVSPGGRHGDGKTENKLIVFQDGTYIELIAFVNDDPAHREGHWWGDKGFGVIDYALTLAEGPEAFEELRRQIHNLTDIPQGWKPGELKGGSRLLANGERVVWNVSFPEASSRGQAPFWCFDVTPRELRVPSLPEYTMHPCGAVGLGALNIHLEEQVQKTRRSFTQLLHKPDTRLTHFEELLDLFSVIIGHSSTRDSQSFSWELTTPRPVESITQCQIRFGAAEREADKLALERKKPLVASIEIRVAEPITIDPREVVGHVQHDEVLFTLKGCQPRREA